MGPKVIMVLSDSDLDKLNNGGYSKYQLYSSKIYMTCLYVICQRQIDLKQYQHDTR